MKFLNSVFLILVVSVGLVFTQANKVLAKEALYIVPTKPELVDFSRFRIEIVEAYKNDQTSRIAYKFPEVLVGQKDRILEFNRVPGTANSWQAPEAQAHCNVTNDVFSCNIHLNKDNHGDVITVGNGFSSRLSKDFALEHLKNMVMPLPELQGFTQVIEDFFAGEPAGILMYEI